MRPPRLRAPRRRGHGALAVRAARAAGAALGGRRGRPRGARSESCSGSRDVHGDDRRPRQGRRRRGPRQRPAPRPRDRRAARLRAGAADARARRAPGGAAVASRALRPAHDRRRVPSGLLVGGALGFVYTPCASPILAAVISVGAASGARSRSRSPTRPGSAVVLLALMLGGRRLFDRVRSAGRGPALQRALGAIMLATAFAMLANARRELRPVRRAAHPRRQPHRLARVLLHGHRAPASDHRPAPALHPRQRLLDLRRLRPRPAPGGARTRARSALLADARTLPRTSARLPNSPKPSAGSTRPGRRRCRSRRCAATWCSWTSGPTRASTASARSPT